MLNVAIRRLLTSLIALFLLGLPTAYGQDPKFQRFFVNKTDQRSWSEKLYNSVGIQSTDIGRSFALIVGVWDYPNLSSFDGHLDAARRDVSLLRAYLAEQEKFDEIVVLANEDFTEDNLRYFLQSYFPKQLNASPGSRFFFGFTGHGFDLDNEGFLLRSNAISLSDEINSLSMAALRVFLNPITRLNAKVGVFINACSSGNFQIRSFGPSNFFIRHPGAHAITASRRGQRSLAIGEKVGSVFFESLLAAVSKGYADTYPPAIDGKEAGDGIITMNEAFTWLDLEVRRRTNNQQQPLLGDLTPSNAEGSFFFLNQKRQVAASNVKAWDPSKVVLFGASQATGAAPAHDEAPRSRDAHTAPLTAGERALGSGIDVTDATTKIEKDKAQPIAAQDASNVTPNDAPAPGIDKSKNDVKERSPPEPKQSYYDPFSFKKRGDSEPSVALPGVVFGPDLSWRRSVAVPDVLPPLSADQLRQREKRDQADRSAYRAAEATNTTASYQKYLRDFENGIYASAARVQLERLSGSASDIASVDVALKESDEPKVGATVRIRIQKSLEALGYNVGGVDGVFGPKTRAAIGEWQRAENVSPYNKSTGFLSKAQMEDLLEEPLQDLPK